MEVGFIMKLVDNYTPRSGARIDSIIFCKCIRLHEGMTQGMFNYYNWFIPVYPMVMLMHDVYLRFTINLFLC